MPRALQLSVFVRLWLSLTLSVSLCHSSMYIAQLWVLLVLLLCSEASERFVLTFLQREHFLLDVAGMCSSRGSSARLLRLSFPHVKRGGEMIWEAIKRKPTQEAKGLGISLIYATDRQNN